MAGFHIVYYINLGCPDIEYSLNKAGQYLSKGVKSLQFDLPSRYPYRETPFIKEKMKYAYEKYGNYDYFLDALTEFRRQHPYFEMQMVSYEDVILTIGSSGYIDFCKRNNIKTCRISGDGVIEVARKDMNKEGIDTLTFIDYNMRQDDIDFARETGRAVMLRNVREGMQPRDGMVSWKDRIAFIRSRGVTSPIYATAGLKCGADLIEAKKAGAAGAFVGSVIMKHWDDEEKMFAVLMDFEKAANS